MEFHVLTHRYSLKSRSMFNPGPLVVFMVFCSSIIASVNMVVFDSCYIWVSNLEHPQNCHINARFSFWSPFRATKKRVPTKRDGHICSLATFREPHELLAGGADSNFPEASPSHLRSYPGPYRPRSFLAAEDGPAHLGSHGSSEFVLRCRCSSLNSSQFQPTEPNCQLTHMKSSSGTQEVNANCSLASTC